MPGKGTGYRPGIPQQPYTKWDADKDEVEVDYKQLEEKRRASWFTGPKGTALKVLLVAVVFSLGLILGYIIRRSVHEMGGLAAKRDCPYGDPTQDYSAEFSRELRNNIFAENIERNLKVYTEKVHIAGTHSNNLLRDRLHKQMADYHLQVSESKYQVLMSYPDWEKPNTVSLVDGNGTVVYQTEYRGPHKPYHPELAPYNAYAPNGTVKGYLVYANFGEEKDFETLHMKGISCKDSIVIVRYGNIYRGEKVKNADKHGASGVILYSDPAQVLAMHTRLSDVYPKSWWLPPYGTQRGSVLLGGGGGDPLTPGLPAVEGMYQWAEDEADLPAIPVQPVGYDDAERLMAGMAGPAGPTSFHGSLSHNVTYQLGPGYDSPNDSVQVELEVNNEREVREITDVFGTIEGREEPDHYVIVGCHYDAWTYGGIDPNSGTSILMEVARALSNMTLRGWRPRRTIIFAHWDAQEQNLIGSYEWVEEHFEELSQGAVAYVNLDGAVMGNYTLGVQATPLLHGVIVNASRTVTPPVTSEGFSTLYDMWTKRSPATDNKNRPRMERVGSGSDQAAFLYTLGVPVMWPQFFHDHGGVEQPSYPTYHTALDNFEVMSRFVDPNFTAHKALGQLVADVVLKLATSAKLPYDPREYASFLKNEFNSLRTSAEVVIDTDVFGVFNLSRLNYLQWAIGNFSEHAEGFMELYQNVSVTEARQVERFNRQLLRLSRAFIHSQGLPGRPLYRNILFAPSAADSYSGSTFTGVRDAMSQFSKDTSNQHNLIKRVEEQISIATLAVRTASNILTRSVLTS